jgi:hypothetical protein
LSQVIKLRLRYNQRTSYFNIVSDYDENDPPGNEKAVDDKIKEVTLETRQENKENDIIPSDNGSISGTFDDNGNKLPFVEIKLLDSTLAMIVWTTLTNEIGAYSMFEEEVEPGDHTVAEVIPDGFLSTCSLSDYDNCPDGDVGVSDTKLDDSIETWRRRN